MNTLISRLIDDSEINAILPDNRNSIEYIYYQQLLDNIARNNDLQSVLIVSPKYDVLVSAPEILSEQIFIYLQGSKAFQNALDGITAVSNIQNYAGEKFMSAFAPIQNIDGFIMAVLITEARANYFHIISNLRNRLLLFSLINLVLIIMIAFFLSIMIKRAIQYQAAIKEQERLVQLGTMAATVAHELRNPLNIIEGTNDVIQKKYGQDGDEVFTYIPKEIQRLPILIDNFLKFARNPVLNIELKTISKLIDRIKSNFSDEEKEQLEITKPDSKIKINTDHAIVEQVLINLIKNAFEASNANDPIKLKIESIQKKKLKTTVDDQGSGISAETMNKVFDPFFTTKEKGTGLGLAIIK